VVGRTVHDDTSSDRGDPRPGGDAGGEEPVVGVLRRWPGCEDTTSDVAVAAAAGHDVPAIPPEGAPNSVTHMGLAPSPLATMVARMLGTACHPP
jgi:hypothetical protein